MQGSTTYICVDRGAEVTIIGYIVNLAETVTVCVPISDRSSEYILKIFVFASYDTGGNVVESATVPLNVAA